MSGADRPYRVSVIGASDASAAECVIAERLGEALARAGCVVVCGGLGGVMAAAAKGATAAGGLTIGLLPSDRSADANPWIGLPVATGMGEARNVLVVNAGEAVVAVGGSWGTLSEIALAKRAGLAVGVLSGAPVSGLDLPAFERPEEAAEWALREARTRRTEATAR